MHRTRQTRKNESHRDVSRESFECACGAHICKCGSLHRTRHFEVRQSQRGVSQQMLELVYALGSEAGSDKIVLGQRELQRRLAELETEKRLLLKVMDKGGLTVVETNHALITTYCGANRKH